MRQQDITLLIQALGRLEATIQQREAELAQVTQQLADEKAKNRKTK